MAEISKPFGKSIVLKEIDGSGVVVHMAESVSRLMGENSNIAKRDSEFHIAVSVDPVKSLKHEDVHQLYDNRSPLPILWPHLGAFLSDALKGVDGNSVSFFPKVPLAWERQGAHERVKAGDPNCAWGLPLQIITAHRNSNSALEFGLMMLIMSATRLGRVVTVACTTPRIEFPSLIDILFDAPPAVKEFNIDRIKLMQSTLNDVVIVG